MCFPYWWCTKHAHLIMGILPIHKKTLPTNDLNKNTFYLIKYVLTTFIFFLSFWSVLVWYEIVMAMIKAKPACCHPATFLHHMAIIKNVKRFYMHLIPYFEANNVLIIYGIIDIIIVKLWPWKRIVALYDCDLQTVRKESVCIYIQCIVFI